ncbi:DNA helicase INO80 [Clonorchis sinensis]|uniref:Chromatin-remodeling ATPase INO80 n=1 Tax=Clonorchis sinensis TaxID=79923 RepID=G7YMH7_CLOSI|nr:DNA helicase INO80 [Clonorchis sinensis]
MELIKEIEELDMFVRAPATVLFADADSVQQLSQMYWEEQWSRYPELRPRAWFMFANFREKSYSLSQVNLSSMMIGFVTVSLPLQTIKQQQRRSNSFRSTFASPAIAREIGQMVAEWRAEAREKVSRMTDIERFEILADLGIPGYAELAGRDVPRAAAIPGGSMNSPVPTSPKQSTHPPSSTTARKRKSSLLLRGARFAKQSRLSGYSRFQRKASKRRNLKAAEPVRPAPDEQKAASQLVEDEKYDDEEDLYEDEEEDQLTVIVRRQREVFSARVAAGRPSIRNSRPPSTTATNTTTAASEYKLSGASSAALARAMLSNKMLREWKALARKVVCKVARQWIATRRDKMSLAKRAARDCARLMRQRALVSQKSTRDAVSRAQRLAREISANWHSSIMSVSNGNGPLTVNGVQMPSSTQLLRYAEHYSSSKTDNGAASETPFVESATAARRRAERAAAEQRRADLELLEARRQQRKLNFLITQTELYAHFMARKLDRTAAAAAAATGMQGSGNGEVKASRSSSVDEQEDDDAQQILQRLDEADEYELDESSQQSADDVQAEKQPQSTEANKTLVSNSIAVAARAAAQRLGISPEEEEYEIERLKSQALSKVNLAVEKERQKRAHFQQLHPAACSDSKPDANTPEVHVEAPSLFQGSLKGYQLRGLTWLLGLFDQGINGILADEMGLGKTIQAIAFLGHLAEKYNIWGPFLVVAPASTLHNWTQEFAKFLPSFRLVPYWGNPAERKVLRRFWFSARPQTAPADFDDSPAPLADEAVRALPGTRDAEMHVVITSYQIVLQDAKFINKTPWAYIVLDEAHAIKSTASLRWRILLSFKCRNRLLLTGTPIQNTMQELWALLHFIMPTLFDSHDEFANWFSRDIESQVTATSAGGNGGGGASSTMSLATSRFTENQLSRLHLILKPFMLRRTKAEVEHEISTKTEITLNCPLSQRQQLLYERLRNKIRLEDLSTVIGANGFSETGPNSTVLEGAGSSSTAHLINLVMQLRKVCNHPDLWERRESRFSCITGAVQPSESEFASCFGPYDAGAPTWTLPRLLYDEGKLVTLDALLNRLKPEGHRVLIYSQMTRMIDILEDFMIYRKHAYLRLDGSSRLCDRRDMVAQWQSSSRWFVFLLSTRAGGLGINLTAADTVIFYDSDWNPTVDQQAMDRAHRLGQTKPVTVYRLVCQNTIEGRMMQRAEEKRAMQQMVIHSGQDNGARSLLPPKQSADQLTSSDMVSLLLDDDELVKRLQLRRQQQAQRCRPTRNPSAGRILAGNMTSVSSTTSFPTATAVESGGDLVAQNSAPSYIQESHLERKRSAVNLDQLHGLTRYVMVFLLMEDRPHGVPCKYSWMAMLPRLKKICSHFRVHWTLTDAKLVDIATFSQSNTERCLLTTTYKARSKIWSDREDSSA